MLLRRAAAPSAERTGCASRRDRINARFAVERSAKRYPRPGMVAMA